MASGLVKWFNPSKGYGFIIPDSGGDDVFLHITDLKKSGKDRLNEGERVVFETQARPDGKLKAIKITAPGP